MKVRWSIVIIFVTLSQACEKITWNPLLNKKHIAVIILARGGSKGIPLKNLSKVGNKTLLNIALIAAYKTKYFDSIWVSTDNTRIYKEALTTGTNVHWRSAASATDTASSIIAVQEFLTFHPEIDVIALIQCTSPFIRVEYLQKALALFRSKSYNCVFTVTKFDKLLWKQINGTIVPLNFNPKARPRRQDLTNKFVENGMFYISSRQYIQQGFFQDFREVFDACSYNDDPLHGDVFKHLLSTCKLDTGTLKIIWDLTGPSQGPITKTNLYKALSLIGWSQEGKIPSNKLFDNFNGKEYPTPKLTDLATLNNVKTQINSKSNSAILGLSYSDIKQLDSINVELVPEKKGLILKYSEYNVSSRRFSSKVTRRYNDFVALYELLLARFPYRLVPRLPPKKIVSDSHFLESRRRALQRWLTLVSRHPSICHDALVSFFLTDRGPDFQYRVRDIFRRAPDEFMTSENAATAKSLLPSDCSEFATNREQVRLLVQVVSKLKQLTDAEIERRQAYARDAEELAHQLKILGGVNPDQLANKHWRHMQKGFSALSGDILALPSKSNYHASLEQVTVCERLGLLLDVLTAHRDLCERLERGLAHDHQAALAKMLSLKKRKIQGVIRGADSESVEQLEAKMMAQENIITNMELRSDFSLYCVHMETQLVHAYLETLSSIFYHFVSLNARAHSEFAEVWKDLQPTIEKYFPTEEGNSNGTKVS